MGKSAEALDERKVIQSILVCPVSFGIYLPGLDQAEFLHFQIFGMSQRQIEKRTLRRCQFAIQLARNTFAAKLQCLRVCFEGPG